MWFRRGLWPSIAAGSTPLECQRFVSPASNQRHFGSPPLRSSRTSPPGRHRQHMLEIVVNRDYTALWLTSWEGVRWARLPTFLLPAGNLALTDPVSAETGREKVWPVSNGPAAVLKK